MRSAAEIARDRAALREKVLAELSRAMVDHDAGRPASVDRAGRAAVSREQFVSIPGRGPGRSGAAVRRDRDLAMNDAEAVMKALVIEGVLETCDRSGDYSFFRHRGRAFPKLWRARKKTD